MSDLALAVRHLDVTRGTFHLRDVSFDLPTGHGMGLIGPSGAGKTTIIRCLLGVLRPDAGEINVLGRILPASVDLRQDIGVVLDHTYLVEDWRLTDVEAAVRPFYPRWDPTRFRELLDTFGLDRTQRVKDLTRGQTTKLTIAVAMSHNARLLLLDEPTSGLDAVARDELAGILDTFQDEEEHAVLFSTRIATDLERIADYVTFINNGRVVHSAPKDELLDTYRLVRGGPHDLINPGIELLGMRRTETSVEALVRKGDVDYLEGDLVIGVPSLDEIVTTITTATGTGVPTPRIGVRQGSDTATVRVREPETSVIQVPVVPTGEPDVPVVRMPVVPTLEP